MSELRIYEGCYVELRNGEVVGPLKNDGDSHYPWDDPDNTISWGNDGREYSAFTASPKDIIRVLTKLESANLVSVPLSDRPEAPQGIVATIPPHVLTAAMDAGIKAKPVYEQFVNAILEAGFQAQYGIEFVARSEQPEVDIDALCEEISARLPGSKGFLERPEGSQQTIRGVAERVISYMADKRIPKNESENMIQDSEKTKGGLSRFDLRSIIDKAKFWDFSGVRPIDIPDHYNVSADHVVDEIMDYLRADPTSPPLDGVTIVFSGALSIPRDTHKGIAESLGAKVAGSVHKHTTLVVYGPGAGSKLDKANELCLPRMSEEAWLWLAARFGYGKPTHVSPYGKITSPRVEIEPKATDFRIAPDLIAIALDEAERKFTQTTLHKQDVRSLRIKEIADLIKSEAAKYGPQVTASATPSIPSVQTIEEAIRAAVREWRETNPDMGMVPPISMIAKKVHAVIGDTNG